MIDHAQAVALAQRALAHLEAGTTDQAEDVLRVPVTEYLDPDRWQREIDLVFKRVPLALALSVELPGAGPTRPWTPSAPRSSSPADRTASYGRSSMSAVIAAPSCARPEPAPGTGSAVPTTPGCTTTGADS